MFKFLKTIFLCCATFFLISCSILPGLQNPNTNNMMTVSTYHQPIRSILIPITPALIAQKNTARYIYHVAPADVLTITVWNHPEFAPQTPQLNYGMTPSLQGAAGQEGYLINPNGFIYFPLVGNVHVAGKTVDQIRIKITKRLRKYIRKPHLNVRVADFRGRKVYVLGEVMKPGFIPLNDQPLSIVDAIVMSGSFDPQAADPSHVYVIRGNYSRPEVYWLNARTPEAMILAEHFTLQPGDVLYVSSADAARWNRILNQLLPTLQTIWYTKTITRR